MGKKSFYCPSGLGEASFFLFYIKDAQDLQGLSRAQPARARHRHSQSAPLPCPARPCWPPSQPVIHYVGAQHGPETRAPSQTDGRSEFIYKILSFEHTSSVVVLVTFLKLSYHLVTVTVLAPSLIFGWYKAGVFQWWEGKCRYTYTFP